MSTTDQNVRSSEATGATATTNNDRNSTSIGNLTSSLKPHPKVSSVLVGQTSEYPSSLIGELAQFSYSSV